MCVYVLWCSAMISHFVHKIKIGSICRTASRSKRCLEMHKILLLNFNAECQIFAFACEDNGIHQFINNMILHEQHLSHNSGHQICSGCILMTFLVILSTFVSRKKQCREDRAKLQHATYSVPSSEVSHAATNVPLFFQISSKVFQQYHYVPYSKV